MRWQANMKIKADAVIGEDVHTFSIFSNLFSDTMNIISNETDCLCKLCRL